MAHFNNYPATFATENYYPHWRTTLAIPMDDFEAFDAVLDHWVETGILNPPLTNVQIPNYDGKRCDHHHFGSCLTCGLQVSRSQPPKTHTRPKPMVVVGRFSPMDTGWGTKHGPSRSIFRIASPTQGCSKHLLSGQPPAVRTISASHLWGIECSPTLNSLARPLGWLSEPAHY